MKKEFIEELTKLGRLSDPKLCTYSNPMYMPTEEWGYCVLSMTDKYFYITNCIGNQAKLGELLFEIPIDEIEDKKHSPRIRTTQTFEFTWKGEKFVLGPVNKEMKERLGIKHKLI